LEPRERIWDELFSSSAIINIFDIIDAQDFLKLLLIGWKKGLPGSFHDFRFYIEKAVDFRNRSNNFTEGEVKIKKLKARISASIIGKIIRISNNCSKIIIANFKFEEKIIVQSTIEANLIRLKLFQNPRMMGVYSGLVEWVNIFNQEEKLKIRNNIGKYESRKHKFNIINRKTHLRIERILRLCGGMFEEEPTEFFVFEEIDVDFNFLDQFVTGINNDTVWVQMEPNPPELNVEDAHLTNFVFNQEQMEAVHENNERLTREDMRFQEDIIRDEQITSCQHNVNAIINNLGRLSADAENMACANITWDVNQPFALLRNIFENITNGWKETLVTAFNDRSLRIDTLKILNLRRHIDVVKTNGLLETIINGGRENGRISVTILSRLMEFAGTVDFNLRSIGGKVLDTDNKIISNQTMNMRMNCNLLNAVKNINKELKTGINWLKNTIEKGVKCEFQLAINGITNESNIKLSMTQGLFDEKLNKIRKTMEIGGERLSKIYNYVMMQLGTRIDGLLNFDRFDDCL
jgi:hypothetical protein